MRHSAMRRDQLPIPLPSFIIPTTMTATTATTTITPIILPPQSTPFQDRLVKRAKLEHVDRTNNIYPHHTTKSLLQKVVNLPRHQMIIVYPDQKLGDEVVAPVPSPLSTLQELCHVVVLNVTTPHVVAMFLKEVVADTNQAKINIFGSDIVHYWPDKWFHGPLFLKQM